MTEKERTQLRDRAVLQNRFPPGLFAIFLGVLFLMSEIHVGLIVAMNRLAWHDVAQVIVAMGYWALVATGLTWITRRQIETVYDKPARELAEATAKVADGDFSVYLPTVHTADKYDYLDIMILDFNKMVEELGSIETLKTDFVSNVSHEMKTPIATIKNYAELLQRGSIDDTTRKEYAEIIEQSAGKLSDLISNILRLNKLEHQRIIADKEYYDITRQLYDCILQFENVLDEKNLELEVEIEERTQVYADESLMELVWNNLLSNAVKFTEPGGTIKVQQQSTADKVQIVISDTGCGMNAAQQKHIFDKFYQGDTSHSKDGNGLGLALVKRVLELMDGEIQVESAEGIGSSFIVTLPGVRQKEMLKDNCYE